MDIYSLVLIFSAYSFIGYICEVVYVSSIQKRFVDRGFLNGPFCPVYGFGALLVIFLLQPVSNHILLLFISALLLTSSLEYLTGWLLETLFNTKWWDYSQYKFNIKGRVCLLNSVLFAIMSVIAVYGIHPVLLSLLAGIPSFLIDKIAVCLLLYFTADLLLSLKKIITLNEHLLLLGEFAESLKEKFGSEQWFTGTSIRDIFKAISERTPQEKERLHITPALMGKIESFSRRTRNLDAFIRKFPSITSRRYSISLEHIKDRIEQYIKNRKAHK